ncbi:MAG TPA: peptidyl-prolyl cis-trans isomerase, partial [Anaeromyxobacter sp.]
RGKAVLGAGRAGNRKAQRYDQLSILAALSLAAGAEVVARVDGFEITGAAVAERAAEVRGRGAQAGPDDALDSLVIEVLFAEEARRTGLADAASVREGIERELRRAASAVMAEKEAASVPAPAEQELRRQYHATADSIRLRLVAFPSEDAARVNLALVQRSGNLDDALRSPVPGFETPGGTGPRIRAQLPSALAEAAFAAAPGVPTGPVQLPEGFGIFVVLERNVGDEKGFAEKREALATFLRTQAAEAMREHAREQLRRRAAVTIDTAFLESLGRRTEATPAEVEHAVAKVDGRPIRYRDIEPSVRQLSSASGHLAGPELRKQLVAREIGDRLLEEQAVQRGLLRDPSVVARRPAIERRVLAGVLVERIGASVPAPSEKDIRAFHKANVARTGQDLESTRSAIAAYLRDTRRNEALQAKAGELRSRARIVVFREALQAAARN